MCSKAQCAAHVCSYSSKRARVSVSKHGCVCARARRRAVHARACMRVRACMRYVHVILHALTRMLAQKRARVQAHMHTRAVRTCMPCVSGWARACMCKCKHHARAHVRANACTGRMFFSLDKVSRRQSSLLHTCSGRRSDSAASKDVRSYICKSFEDPIFLNVRHFNQNMISESHRNRIV